MFSKKLVGYGSVLTLLALLFGLNINQSWAASTDDLNGGLTLTATQIQNNEVAISADELTQMQRMTNSDEVAQAIVDKAGIQATWNLSGATDSNAKIAATTDVGVTIRNLKAGESIPVIFTASDNGMTAAKLPITLRYEAGDVGYKVGIRALTVTAYQFGHLKAMSTQKEVEQELLSLAHVTAYHISDNSPISVDQITATDNSDILAKVKGWTAGTMINFQFGIPGSGTHTAVLITSPAATDTGTLSFGSVAVNSTFQTVKLGESTVAMHGTDWLTTISDSRAYGSGWQLNLSISKPFASASGTPLIAKLAYLKDGASPVVVTNSATPIVKGNNKAGIQTIVTKDWNDKTGLALTDISDTNVPGDYTGTLTWSLSNAPA